MIKKRRSQPNSPNRVGTTSGSKLGRRVVIKHSKHSGTTAINGTHRVSASHTPQEAEEHAAVTVRKYGGTKYQELRPAGKATDYAALKNGLKPQKAAKHAAAAVNKHGGRGSSQPKFMARM